MLLLSFFGGISIEFVELLNETNKKMKTERQMVNRKCKTQVLNRYSKTILIHFPNICSFTFNFFFSRKPSAVPSRIDKNHGWSFHHDAHITEQISDIHQFYTRSHEHQIHVDDMEYKMASSSSTACVSLPTVFTSIVGFVLSIFWIGYQKFQ